MLPLGSSAVLELKNAPKKGIAGAAFSALVPSVVPLVLRVKVEW